MALAPLLPGPWRSPASGTPSMPMVLSPAAASKVWILKERWIMISTPDHPD